MSKKNELYTSSEAMKAHEDAIYEKCKAATRMLLLKHNAEDLLVMLGLEEDTNEHDVR